MNLDTDSRKGAPGLRLIRQHLNLTQTQIGDFAGISSEWARLIESGQHECSTGILSKLSEKIGCERSDLLSSPTPERLMEIEIAYRELLLAESKAKREKQLAEARARATAAGSAAQVERASLRAALEGA